MTYGEFVERQAAIIRPVLRWLAFVLVLYRLIPMNRKTWRQLLAQVYPVVDEARRQSSDLARKFYDSERRRRLSDLLPEPQIEQLEDDNLFSPLWPGEESTFDVRRIEWPDDDDIRRIFWPDDDDDPLSYAIDLEPYRFEWFVEDMEPARKGMSEENSTDAAIEKFVAFAEKQIENAGRRTIIRAVDNDPKVIGWARVQGGEDSCAFCMMLISRGPVYNRDDPSKAGLRLDKVSAVELWKRIESGDTEAEEAYGELMKKWHPNCDCKAVPVFDRNNWTGRDAYLAAEEMWKSVTKGLSGREAFNAFRRFIERGAKEEVSTPLRRAA